MNYNEFMFNLEPSHEKVYLKRLSNLPLDRECVNCQITSVTRSFDMSNFFFILLGLRDTEVLLYNIIVIHI